MNDVNRTIIDKWIDKNSPNGIEKLAILSGISGALIAKVRLGLIPRKQSTRDKICSALGCSERELFPGFRQEKAS